MTEAEWLACDEPETLWEFVHSPTTARKCRLVACAHCRHILPLTRDRIALHAVQVAERYADGLESLAEMLAVSEKVGDSYVALPNPAPVNTDPPLSFKAGSIAIQSTLFLTRDAGDELISCLRCTYLAELRWAIIRADPREAVAPHETIMRWQNSLIRDVFGNPFRPVALDPVWRTPAVVSLAEAVYAERAFDRLPQLADALEAAGCDHADILSHCRGPGPHVRGCWVVDLLLGKA